MTVIDHLQYFDFSKIVPFYIGCSFGAEHMLQQAGVPLRHQEQGVNVAMFKTGVNTIEVGVFGGPMVVSMRHIPEALLPKVVNITRRLTRSHGAPVHIGDPSYLKLDPSLSPDFGDFCTPTEGDVPVFWACGITGTVAIEQSGELVESSWIMLCLASSIPCFLFVYALHRVVPQLINLITLVRAWLVYNPTHTGIMIGFQLFVILMILFILH